MNKGNGLFQKVMIKNRDTSPMKPKEASNEVMKMEPSGTEVKAHCKIDVTLKIKYKSMKVNWLWTGSLGKDLVKNKFAGK